MPEQHPPVRYHNAAEIDPVSANKDLATVLHLLYDYLTTSNTPALKT